MESLIESSTESLTESPSPKKLQTQSQSPKRSPRNNASTPIQSCRKLQSRLRGAVGRAIYDYGMIETGDRVMVCLSGGKDSHTLLDLLLLLQQSAPISFEILAVNLDQKQPGFPADVLPTYLESLGVPYRIVEADTYSTVKRVIPEGKTMCGLCSRLRRGILYRVAAEEGVTKIALGHHRDDIVETFFLNLFHAGKLKAMPPKLLTDDGCHVVIRPLAYCAETDIQQYAIARQFPIIPCQLCGSQDNLQRVQIKQMIQSWEEQQPGRTESLFRSLQNVVPSHLADSALFNFAELKTLKTENSPGHPTPGHLTTDCSNEPWAIADPVFGLGAREGYPSNTATDSPLGTGAP